MTQAEQIASNIHPTDYNWFWEMPCHPQSQYPMSFIRHGLVERRRKYRLFGPWMMYLNEMGLEVRAILQDQADE